jgi:Outer membrane protein beta-barrel domain
MKMIYNTNKKSMKNVVLMGAVIIGLHATGNAQTTKMENNNTAHFGLKAGINISNVYDSKGQDFKAKAKVGAVLGGFVSIPFGKYIGIQPEILYSQKGFKGTGSILGSPYSYTRTTNCLDIPLLLAIKPINELTIVVGPQYSFLLSEKNVFENTLFTSVQEQQFNNDNIRKNTLAFLGGADVNFDKVVIGLRAGWDVQNNAGDGTNSTPRYKNVWYQATLGYRF